MEKRSKNGPFLSLLYLPSFFGQKAAKRLLTALSQCQLRNRSKVKESCCDQDTKKIAGLISRLSLFVLNVKQRTCDYQVFSLLVWLDEGIEPVLLSARWIIKPLPTHHYTATPKKGCLWVDQPLTFILKCRKL